VTSRDELLGVRGAPGNPVPVTRLPTAAELDLIRGRLDPSGLRGRELA
jgi:hypothetical protein